MMTKSSLSRFRDGIIFLLLFVSIPFVSFAQPMCTGGAPYYVVDMTGDPDGTYISPLEPRDGECCGSSNPDRCVEFSVTLDPNAVGISMDVFAGASPTGALFFQVDCGPEIAVGETFCLDGVGPHSVTFCKPGGNENSYIINSVGGLSSQPTTAWQGCQEPLVVTGEFDESSITWNDITGGGQYNVYLSCTMGCDSVTLTPDFNAPAVIEYEVCASIPGLTCNSVSDCDTIAVNINQPLNTVVFPNPAEYCADEVVPLFAQVDLTGNNIIYEWYDQANGAGTLVSSDPSYTPQVSGDYSVIVEDISAGGCSIDTMNIPVNILPLPQFVPSFTGVCQGESITLNLQSDLTYNWTPNTGLSCTNCPNPTVTINSTTTYSVTGEDSFGCTATEDLTVEVFPAVNVSLTLNQQNQCSGGADGSATANPTDGRLPYSYLWSSGEVTATSSNLPGGTATVTISDGNGCTTVGSITITEPNPFGINLTVNSTVSCSGGTDGSATVTATGGTPAYTYAWSNGGMTATVDNLMAGTYTVSVTDANGCQLTQSFTMTEPPVMVTSISVDAEVSCNNGSDGQATVSVSGGTPNYTFIWDNNEMTATATNLDGGNHTVTVADANGCTQILSVGIVEPPLLLLTLTQTMAVSCAGLSDGSATGTASGGTPPYAYLWSTNATTATVNNLTAGVHMLTVTDDNGCIRTRNVTITEPPILAATISLNQNITCFGASNGSATVSPAGGTPAYTYVWGSGETTATATNLGTGTQNVVVTDANACQQTLSVTLTEPSLLSASATIDQNVSCNGGTDGTATVTVTGGITPYTYNWENGETGSTATTLAAGQNGITVTDANGCIATDVVTLTEPPLLEITTSVLLNVLCAGDASGSANVSATGGTPIFSYLWDNGEMNATAVALLAGDHFVTVTDANGCIEIGTVTITEPPLLVPTLVNTVAVSCFGENDGAYTVNISGGVAPYDYQWSGQGLSGNGTIPNSQDVSISDLLAGNYIFEVTDANNCVQTINVLIDEPTTLNTVINNANLDRCDICNGTATVSVFGGTGPYTYVWNNGETTNSPTALCEGIPSVTVTDNNGCRFIDEVILQAPLAPTVSVFLDQNVSCIGGSDGSATVSIQGGTPAYTIIWENGETTATATGLVAGMHTVTVSDAAGCGNTAALTITEPPLLTATATLVQDIPCFGDASGRAEVTATGGTTAYTYFWENGETNAIATALPVGTHGVTVTDANGCTATDEVTLTEPTELLVSAVVDNDVTCNGANDGSATASQTGGTPGYSYDWSNGGNTATVGGLGPGSYTVTVTDANGCFETAAVSITESKVLGVNAIVNQEISCFGGSDGEASAVVVGGALPYTYSWTTGSTTASSGPIGPGTYYVVVTDGNFCSVTADVTLIEPPLVETSITVVNNVFCNGESNGSATVSVSNGLAPYTYIWTNGETTETATGLVAGVHFVTVTTANGCTDTNSAFIIEPAVLTAAAAEILPVFCAGDSNGGASVTANGGTTPYTFLWDNAGTAATNFDLDVGVHTVTVTDDNACIVTASVTISEPAPLVLSATVLSGTSCTGDSDGSATVTVSGGIAPYDYLWDNAEFSPTAINLDVGLHVVTVTDDNGCTETAAVTITEPAPYTINTTLQNVSCAGEDDGSISIDIAGGTVPYEINWTGPQSGSMTQATAGTAVISNLIAGTYAVEIIDDNGCTTNFSETITEPTTIDITLSNIMSADCGICNGGATVAASGGIPPYTYTWANGTTSTDAAALCPGVNNVTVTDATGCMEVGNAVIPTITSLAITNQFFTEPTCAGASDGTAGIEISGGVAPYIYAWSNGIPDTDSLVTGLPAGTYSVSVTSGVNCLQSTVIVIGEPATVTANPTVLQGPSCVGASDGTATANATGGTLPYSYIWDTAETTETATGLNAGIHFVTIADNNNCTIVESVEVENPTVLNAANIIVDDVSCNGNSDGIFAVLLNGGDAPYTYVWDGPTTGMNTQGGAGGSQVSGVPAGAYSITVTDNNNCQAFTTAVVSEPAILGVNVSLNNNISCVGDDDGSATANPTGGTTPYQYVWSNGELSGTANSLAPGMHTVTVTDNHGCTTTGQITITSPTPLISATVESQAVSCYGGNDGVATTSPSGGTPPYTYFWQNGANTQTVSGLSAGNFQVLITDANGCRIVDGVVITEPTQMLVQSTVTQNVTCSGFNDASATLTISGGIAPYNYAWAGSTPGSGTLAAAGAVAIPNLGSGPFQVTVTDQNNCETFTNFTINEPSELIVLGTTVLSGVSCTGESDGRAEVSVNGGTLPYVYLWDTGESNAIATQLDAGLHMVTVTDDNGCFETGSVTITEPTTFSVGNIQAVNNVSCNGGNDGSAQITVMGGTAPYNYNWSNGGITPTINNLTIGTYTVTVTDANQCFVSSSLTITEPPALQAATTLDAEPNCSGGVDGQGTISVSGGRMPYTYLWSNGVTNVSAFNLSAGTYSITTTDANNCTIVAVLQVTEPPVLQLSATNTMPVSCYEGSDGSLSVSIQGGTAPYNYTISGAGGSGTQATAGTFTVTGLSAGNYLIQITDALGCVTDRFAQVMEPLPLAIMTTVVQEVSCTGGSDGMASVTSSGGTSPYIYNWSTTEQTPSISNLLAGIYTVTVTDNNGCTITSEVEITEPIFTTATAVAQEVSCFGESDGSATASISGGIAPYTYLWDNAETNATAIELDAGMHSVSMYDGNGCLLTATVEILEPNELLGTLTIEATVSCNGGRDGAASVSASGGTMPYTYLWNNPSMTATATGLSAGSVSVTVTDANGCFVVFNDVITEPTAVTASTAVSSNVDCFGGNNGSASVAASGGLNPYQYLWNNGETTSQITGLTAGQYDVIITDDNGCSTTASATVTEPSLLGLSTSIDQTVTCNGLSDGAATATASGGTLPYTYLWENGTIGTTVNNLPQGEHFVTVTDNNACTATALVTITEPTDIIGKAILDQNVSCNGGNDGAATLTAFGGTPPFTYLWDNGSMAATVTNFTAGNHSATITDQNGCFIVVSIPITEPPVLMAQITIDQTVSCASGSDGIATVLPQGGTAPYTYAWSNGGAMATTTDLSVGLVTVTVTDDNGCLVIASGSVAEPTPLLSSISSTTAASCFSNNDGSALASPSGGTAPYTYLWQDGQINPTAFNLSGGPISVTITDALGCQSIAAGTIGQPDPIGTQIINFQGIQCNGDDNGEATIFATGGTTPYTYEWDNGEITAAVNNLTPGVHTVTVTDDNGCTGTTTVFMTEPAVIATFLDVNSEVTCFGGADGSANVTIFGGTQPYTVLWDNDETTTTATALNAGIHFVSITDSNNCISIGNVLVVGPELLNIQFQIFVPVSCFGDSDGVAVTFANGGTAPYTYLWDNGETSQGTTNLSAGTHTVSITDAQGCSATAAVVMPGPDLITTSMTNIGAVACFGESNGSATVSVSGGNTPYQYLWNNGATTATTTALVVGQNTVTITDFTGCVAEETVTITQPDLLVAAAVEGSAVNCFGESNGEATVTPSGGTATYTYLWDNAETDQTATALAVGVHIVTVTDFNACTVTTQVTITEPTLLTATATEDSGASCAGELDATATATPAGGTAPYSYTWDNAETTPTAIALGIGTHTVVVTDANGCLTQTTVLITEPESLTGNATATSTVQCFGESNGIATVVVSGGTKDYQYLWDNGEITATASSLDVGPHAVTVTDAQGCTLVATAMIAQPDVLAATVEGVVDATCFGEANGMATASTSGGLTPYTYLWDNGETTSTAILLAEGTRSVTITDENGCTTVAQTSIGQPISIVAELSFTSPTCFGDDSGSITVSASNGVGGYTYSLDGTSFVPNPVIQNIPAGDYTVIVMDANMCQWSGDITVHDAVEVEVDARPDGVVNLDLGLTVDLNAFVTISDPVTYNWSPAEGLSCTDCQSPTAFPFVDTQYTVTATTVDGCVATDVVTIVVNEKQEIFTPNVFTPNDDSNNDVFVIFGGPSVAKINVFRIYDRWGELVFEAQDFQPNDPSFGWNGTLRGKLMNPAVFVYYVEYEYVDGQTAFLKGDVTLLK